MQGFNGRMRHAGHDVCAPSLKTRLMQRSHCLRIIRIPYPGACRWMAQILTNSSRRGGSLLRSLAGSLAAMKSGGGVLLIGFLQLLIGVTLLGKAACRRPAPPATATRPDCASPTPYLQECSRDTKRTISTARLAASEEMGRYQRMRKPSWRQSGMHFTAHALEPGTTSEP